MGKVATAKAKAEQQALIRTQRNRRLLAEAHVEAKEFAIKAASPRVDPAEAMQEILDRMVAMYRYATQQVMTLDESEYWLEALGGPLPHHWIREQERLGMQIVHIAGKASAMGVAERQIRLQEAQAAIFATIAELAMEEAGLSAETKLLVHDKIAQKLEDIEGTSQTIGALVEAR